MKKAIKYTFLVLAVLGLDSCKNLVEDASTDPVNITDPSVVATSKFFSGAQVGLITSYEADVNRLTGMWTGHFSGEDRQYIPLNNYVVAARDFNVEWANIYGTLAQLNIILERAEQENNPKLRGMAQIMQAMLYGLAADLWGDVPLTEALQFPDITQPKYDSQLEIYAAVQSLLSQGIENLKSTVANRVPADADVFFKNDVAQWTRAAYTLKARYYLHTKEYARAIEFSDPTLAIDAPANNMLAPHGSNYQQNFNLFYSFTTYDRPGYMGADAYAPRLMDPAEANSRNNAKTNEEARLWYFYLPGGGGNFGEIAYEPNVLADFDWGNESSANGFFGATTSFPLVTYEENLLIRAEAFAKLSNFTESLAALNTLRAYFDTGDHINPGYTNGDFADYWGTDPLGNNYDPYVAADFNSGGIANPGTETALDALLREILEERYITLTGQLEVFNDVRRTKNLLGLPVASGAASFPQRLLYPQSELNANASNVPQADLYTPTPVNATPY
jgi:starch-binding outer membrane protein, SusD/RagB family